MNAEQLRARQAPLKERYRTDPGTAILTLRAEGAVTGELGCTVEIGPAHVVAGLHPAAGGTAGTASPVTLLLSSLVTCFGVTLQAVSIHMGIHIRHARIFAEGDIDLRGTLGVGDDIPVGLQKARLDVVMDTQASDAQVQDLLALVRKYAVVFQTLERSVPMEVSYRKDGK